MVFFSHPYTCQINCMYAEQVMNFSYVVLPQSLTAEGKKNSRLSTEVFPVL